jgi:6-phosphofructokinase 1
VTVSGIKNGKIQYVQTAKAIEQRHVDLQVVSLHEQLGMCFGRKPEKMELESEELKGKVERYL